MTIQFDHKHELDAVLDSKNIRLQDICLVGGIVLHIKGIRDHVDLDICILSNKDPIKPGKPRQRSHIELSDNIDLWHERYAPLGLSDDDLIKNPEYHESVDGYKVVRLEIEFAYKLYRASKRDKDDNRFITEKAINSDDWDWELVRSYLADKKQTKAKKTDAKRVKRLVLLVFKGIKDPRKGFTKIISILLRIVGCSRKAVVPTKQLQSQLITKIPTGALLGKQFSGNNFCRYDLLLRYLAIKAYDAGQSEIIDAYTKMQALRGTGHFSRDIKSISDSIKHDGFLSRYPISISQEGYLIDGAHRLACALYHGVEEIPVDIQPTNRSVDYGLQWFVDKGFNQAIIDEMESIKNMLFEKYGVWFVVLLWPPAAPWFEEIAFNVKSKYRFIWEKELSFRQEEFSAFVRNVYSTDDIEKWKIELKIHCMKEYDKRVRILVIELPIPQFRAKSIARTYLSIEGESIKNWIRENYKDKIQNYFYDIICHIGDNQEHNKNMFQAINEFQNSSYAKENIKENTTINASKGGNNEKPMYHRRDRL